MASESPMDRFAVTIADPMTMETVGQRVMEGESLKQIARSWELPVMRFIEWVVNDLARLQVYEAALRIRADDLAHETLQIADNQDGDTRRDALRVKTRMTMAGHWDRQRYGDVVRKDVSITHRRHASELTDDELLALIQNAQRDARAIEGKSHEVLQQAKLMPPEPVVEELI